MTFLMSLTSVRGKTLRGLFLLIVCGMVSACSALTSSQQKATHSYATSTMELGQFSAAEFSRIQQDIVQMNALRFALQRDKKVKDADFYRTVQPADISSRIAAADALAAYGLLLSTLLSEDPADDLEDAAEKFADHSAFALGDDFDEYKQKAVKSLVEKIGSFWIERERAKALTVIISDYQPVVDQLAGLLAQDLTLAKAGSGTEPGLLYAYQSVAKSLKNQAWPIVNGGENYNYAERKVAVDALLTAEQAMMRIESLSVASDKVLTGLQQSNAIIVQVLKDKDYAFSDIKAYAKDIRDLARIYRSLAAS
ncbi:MAG: hypothetical protein CMI13_10905 [Oleibacter sp.]|nr:hypothetical protein [Thalassolituus sp.]